MQKNSIGLVELSSIAAGFLVADTMLKGRIHRVFVTRDRKLVGIVTALDMLQVIRDI